MSRPRRQPAPWPLDRLLTADRNAGTVYFALIALAGGKRQVCKTRAGIRAVCHLSEKRITSAMHALRDGRWIRLAVKSSGARSWYVVTIRFDWFHEGPKTTVMDRQSRRARKPMKGAKRPSCKRTPRTENDLHGRASMRGAKRPSLSRESRRHPSADALPSRSASAGDAQHPAQNTGGKQNGGGPLIPISDALGLKPEKPAAQRGRNHA